MVYGPQFSVLVMFQKDGILSFLNLVAIIRMIGRRRLEMLSYFSDLLMSVVMDMHLSKTSNT